MQWRANLRAWRCLLRWGARRGRWFGWRSKCWRWRRTQGRRRWTWKIWTVRKRPSLGTISRMKILINTYIGAQLEGLKTAINLAFIKPIKFKQKLNKVLIVFLALLALPIELLLQYMLHDKYQFWLVFPLDELTLPLLFSRWRDSDTGLTGCSRPLDNRFWARGRGRIRDQGGKDEWTHHGGEGSRDSGQWSLRNWQDYKVKFKPLQSNKSLL